MISKSQDENGNTIMNLSESLCIYQAPYLRSELLNYIENHDCLIFNLNEVEECDAAGIQLMCSALKTATDSHKQFRIFAPSPVVLKTIADMGLKPEEMMNS